MSFSHKLKICGADRFLSSLPDSAAPSRRNPPIIDEITPNCVDEYPYLTCLLYTSAAPAVPSRIELTPGYFQITATPHLAVYDPTVQFEFWFSEKRITDIRQVETTARYLGTALYLSLIHI